MNKEERMATDEAVEEQEVEDNRPTLLSPDTAEEAS